MKRIWYGTKARDGICYKLSITSTLTSITLTFKYFKSVSITFQSITSNVLYYFPFIFLPCDKHKTKVSLKEG